MSGALAVAGWASAVAAGAACIVLAARARAGREIVARASHEVRGPLHAAGLVLETMTRGGEAPVERLFALDAQLHRARVALDDLEGAPARRGGVQRERRLEAGVLVDAIAAAWQPAVAAAGRRLRLVDPAPAALLGDPDRLAQAAGNLIANALEHGTGDVEMRLRRVADTVRLEVRDEGPGLPVPVPQLAARARGGRGRRGRGIAIAADIAERHGGRLVATGNVVALELPPAPEAA